MDQLEENVLVCKTSPKMNPGEIKALLERTAKGAVGSKIEQYKRPQAAASLDHLHQDGEWRSE